MNVKRTWRERLFSLTPWVTHRPETQIERDMRRARDLRPSQPMYLTPLTGNAGLISRETTAGSRK